jgi:hypothetical protein
MRKLLAIVIVSVLATACGGTSNADGQLKGKALAAHLTDELGLEDGSPVYRDPDEKVACRDYDCTYSVSAASGNESMGYTDAERNFNMVHGYFEELDGEVRDGSRLTIRTYRSTKADTSFLAITCTMPNYPDARDESTWRASYFSSAGCTLKRKGIL